MQAILSVENPREEDLLILATRLGEVKALRRGQLSNIQNRGLIVMDLEPGDELVSVAQLGDAQDVVMISARGQAIRFSVEGLRPRSRAAGGVRGMRLLDGDTIIGMNTISPKDHLLVVSEGGYGKLTSMARYPQHSREGRGCEPSGYRQDRSGGGGPGGGGSSRSGDLHHLRQGTGG